MNAGGKDAGFKPGLFASTHGLAAFHSGPFTMITVVANDPLTWEAVVRLIHCTARTFV